MTDKSTPSTLDKVGGRKAAAFYASLASILLLALLGKATTEIMGLIDTLLKLKRLNLKKKRRPHE